jgi:phenylalanyl-tRNA synthetase beta chain
MRSSLVCSLVQVLCHNLARRQTRVRVFELGRVFRRNPAVADGPHAVAGVDQPQRLAGLAYGPVDAMQWGAVERTVDFFDVKGDVEALLAPLKPVFIPAEHPAMHPGRCARVQLDGLDIGVLGELHPRWRQAYELPLAPVMFELALDALLKRPVPAYAPLPRQQAVTRDLAVIVGDAVAHDAVMATIGRANASISGLVRSARLFDVYRSAHAHAGMQPDERSLAIRLELLDDDAPLTDARSDDAVAAVVQRLQAELGARLRGQ